LRVVETAAHLGSIASNFGSVAKDVGNFASVGRGITTNSGKPMSVCPSLLLYAALPQGLAS